MKARTFVPALALCSALAAGPADTVPQAEFRVVEAANEFGFSLFYDQVVNRMFENVFVSPCGAALALAMAWNGAAGVTREEMAAALALGDLSPDEVNRGNLALISELPVADSGLELLVANSLWAGKGTGLKQEFADACREFYDARVAELDFGMPGAAGEINEWARASTGGRIGEIVAELSAEDVLVLANAVYFKGRWQTTFDQKLTREREFFGLDSVALVPMMRQAGEFRYLSSDGWFQAVELPYGGGRLSMYVFLPDSSVGLLGFCDFLNPGNWADWLAGFETEEGEVVLPKFGFEYEATLNEVLERLGAAAAFDPATADFSGMTDSAAGLYLSEVRHKTFVEVSEQGTEAAAVTALRIPMNGDRPFSMVVDQPFFCAVRDNGTGALLFLGTVYEP